MIGELENKFPLQASADMLPSSSSATSARRGYRTDDTTDDVSSEDEIGENRNRIRKKRSICHAMSSSLMIAKNRNRSSSIESLEAEMELSPSRRRRIRPRPNNSQSPLSTKEARLAEVDEKGPLSGYSTCSSLTEFQHSDNESHSTRSPSPAEHDKRTFRKRLHKDTPSSSPEPSRRQRRRGTVSSGSDSPTRKRTKGGSSKKSLCHNAEPTQSFTIKSNAPHLMSYETKQVISYTKCVTCGELTKSTHTELNVNLQTAQQQPIVNYVPIPVAVPLPLQHLYPQPVSVRELVQQSEEELGHGERMLMVALRRKVTPH